MASESALIGLLRVLLTANTAEYETAMKRSANTTDASVQGIARSLKSLSGTDLLRSTNNTIAAIEKLGGVSKLTAAEQEKVHAQVSQALAKYQALGQEAPKALKDLELATRKVEETARQTVEPLSRLDQIAKDFSTTFKATLAGFISAQAIIGAVRSAWGTLTEFVSSSIQAYSDQEAAVRKMTTALQAQGRATPETLKQYKAMATQFQQTTVHADELINEMQALLVQVGNVMPHEMEAALKAATDLSSGLGIDLRQATMLVGKAFEGETGTLKRYGIVIDETKLKAQGVTAVLDAVQDRFGGQAQSEAESYAGKLKQIANAWGEVKEAVGAAIVANPIAEASLRGLHQRLTEGQGGVEDYSHSWSEFARGFPNAVAMFAAPAIRLLEGVAAATNAAHAAQQKLIKDAPKLPVNAPGALVAAPGTEENIEREIQLGKEAKQAADEWRKAIKALREELSGGKLDRELQLLAAATAGLTVEQLKQPAVMDRVAEAIRKLRLEGVQLTPELLRVDAIVRRFTVTVEDFFRLAQRNRGFEGFFTDTFLRPQVWLPLDGLGDRIQGFFDKVVTRNDDFGKFVTNLRSLVDLSKGIEGAPLFEGFFNDTFLKARTDNLTSMRESVDDLIGALQHLSTMAPEAIGNVIASVSDLVAGFTLATDAAGRLGDSSLTWMQRLSAGIDLVSGAFQIGRGLMALGERLFGDRGRDLVEAFAAQHGGFDALHNELLALGADGERLWIKLTQGVGRNNPEQAKAAIEEVTKALQNGATAAAQAARENEAATRAIMGILTPEEMQALTKGYRQAVLEGFRGSKDEFLAQQLAFYDSLQEGDSRLKTHFLATTLNFRKLMLAGLGDLAEDFRRELSTLDTEIQSLQSSIAGEAPEEFMGIIEQQARARLSVLEDERKKIEEELRETAEAVSGEATEVGQTIDDKIGGSIRDIGRDLRGNQSEWDAWGRHVRGVINGLSGLTVHTPRPGGGGSPMPTPGVVDGADWVNSRGAIEAPVNGATFAAASTVDRSAPPVGNHATVNIYTIDQQGVQQFVESRAFQEPFKRELILNPTGLGSAVREAVSQGS